MAVTTAAGGADEAGWPIIERFGLFEQVAQAERGCVLVGPAGAGKSTTARIVAGEDGRRAVVVTGVVGLSSIPLGALSMAEMTTPLNGLTAPPEQFGGRREDDHDDDLVTQVRTWLETLRHLRMPVVIDDPAALDADSLTLLTDAIHDGLVAIVTHRPHQAPPAPLDGVIAELDLPRIEIEPLDASMIMLAVEQATGHTISDDGARQLASLSGGNPLLLREIVRDLSIRQAWTETAGELGLPPAPNMPSVRLVDLFRSRLPIDPEIGELLQLIAHTGTVPLDLARTLATPDALATLALEGWVELGETVSVAHPVMAQVVTERLDELSERRLLQRAVDAITAAGPTDRLEPGSRLRYLRWALTADSELSPTDLRWGRVEAGRRFDRDLACLIADRLAVIDPTLDTVLELALVLAQAERYDEVVIVLVRASEQVGDRAGVVDVARFLLRFAGPLARLKHWGEPPSGLDRLTAAWADDALGTTAFGSLLQAMQALADGELPMARAHAEQARREAVEGLDADADEIAMLAALYSGDQAGALVAFERLGARLADPTYRHPKAVVIDAAASSLLMLAGRFEDACDFDRRVRAAARATQDHDRAREMSGHLGMTSLFVGRIDDAIEAFERFLGYPAMRSSLRTIYTAGLAQAHALAGHLDDAERVLAIAERDADVVSPMMQPDFDNLVGMTLHLLGYAEAGEARTREGMRVAGDWLNARSQLMGLLSLARSGRIRDDDLPFAREVLPRASVGAPAFARGVGELVEASHGGDPRAMAAAAKTFASTGFALGATESYAAAIRATADRASRDHAILVATLDSWLARCPGLHGATVLVERTVEALTDREREIAALAGGGLTNQQIADRLGISHRTVENNLHRAFTKLAIGTRAEIREAMSPSVS